jgi:uncharacterized membrane protein
MKALSVSFLILSILCILIAFLFRLQFLSLYRPWWVNAGITAYLIFMFADNFLLRGKDNQWSIKNHPLQVFPVTLLILSIISFLLAALPNKILISDLKWIYTGIVFYLFFELKNFLPERIRVTNVSEN